MGVSLPNEEGARSILTRTKNRPKQEISGRRRMQRHKQGKKEAQIQAITTRNAPIERVFLLLTEECFLATFPSLITLFANYLLNPTEAALACGMPFLLAPFPLSVRYPTEYPRRQAAELETGHRFFF